MAINNPFGLPGNRRTLVESPHPTYNGPMTESLTNPHDHFFREKFSDPALARDFLQHYLPPEMVTLFDLSSLEILKDSFVDVALRDQHSDLLYKVGLHNGRAAYIYLLFEHKSYPDPEMLWQLFRYMYNILEQARKDKVPPPPILPIVFYHGVETWNVAQDLAALFETPDALRPYVLNFRYWLYDLSDYSDEEIKGQVVLQAALLLLKYIMRDELKERLAGMVDLLRTLARQERGLDHLRTMLIYLSRGTDKIDQEALQKVVDEVFEEGDVLMSTIAEQWVEQGLERGRAEGREEGFKEGQHKMALRNLHRILNHRFETSLDRFETDFQPLDLDVITALSDAAFEVESLAEFETRLAEIKAAAAQTQEEAKPRNS